jgi:hypothetical protein
MPVAKAGAMLRLQMLLTTCLSFGLVAQSEVGPRLRDCIAGPIAYAAFDAQACRGADGRSAVLDLISSLSVLGGATGGTAEAAELVHGLLGRAAGEVELAILGVMPSGISAEAAGTPLVVLRTQLSESDARRLETLFADAAVARPERVLAGRQTYVLVNSSEPSASPSMPVEVAVRGRELLVSNYARGLDEAMASGTAASQRCLATDPRFVRLTSELKPDPQSMQVFADVPRCGAHIQRFVGLAGSVLRWSGLAEADALAATVAPHRGDRRPTEQAADALQSHIVVAMPKGELDGWLGAVANAPVRQLAGEVPSGGMGGFVFAVDPARVVRALSLDHGSSERHGHDDDDDYEHPHERRPHSDRDDGHEKRGGRGFAQRIDHSCHERGVDLRHVLQGLGRHGSMQLVMLNDGRREFASVFALQAQSKKAATEIAGVFAAALRRDGEPGPRASSVDLRALGSDDPLHLAPVGEWLVFAQRTEAIAAMQAAQRERLRSRAQVDATLARASRAFAGSTGDEHSGVFHLDLRDVAARSIAAANPAAQAEFPAIHAGIVDVEPAADGASLVRLRVLSTR